MALNGNLPLMSQSEWDNAPFNREENNGIECNVTVSVSMSKDAVITVHDYAIDENGDPDFSETDWESEASDIYTPSELISILKDKLEDEIASDEEDLYITGDLSYTKRIKRNKKLIEQCKNWIEDEHVVAY